MDEWAKICKNVEGDCDFCPLKDFCGEKPCYWDLKALHEKMDDILSGEDE